MEVNSNLRHGINEVLFNGEEGRLEGRYHHSDIKHSPIALVLHPHPLHGGTMNNKVVYTLFHSFAKMGFSVLRFNFRGVGKSHGQFDNGAGELVDAATALDWLESKNPEASSCWVAGFSFGSWIAAHMVMRRPEVRGFVLLSPPADKFDFNFLSPCPVNGLIMQGSADKLVTEEVAYDLYVKLRKQRTAAVDFAIIQGADHSYANHFDEIDRISCAYLTTNVTRSSGITKGKRDRRKRQTVVEKAK